MTKLFCLVLICLFFLAAGAAAQTPGEFNEPWKDPTKALVIDAYKENYLDCAKLAREPRVVGVLFRSSIGMSSDAKEYFEKKKECKDTHNFKWGSYHVGRKGNPEAQAEFYIRAAKPTDDEVIALDLEGIGGINMSLKEVVRFIKKVHELTGRYPLLYVMGSVHDVIIKRYGADSVFAKTPLWYARYCTDISCYFPPVRSSAILDKYLFWQFASEINCRSKKVRRGGKCRQTSGICPLNTCPLPTPLAGTDGDMDVNVYNGTVEELKASWGKF